MNCEGLQYPNRYFMTLRGNEIQNDMWDYDPEYDPAPTDKHRGGYWYQGSAWGRCLHIIALKSHEPNLPKRYNYIVHPLAYRASLNDLPDCNIDGIQWAMNKIEKEAHINNEEWGGKCNGVEVFNDFT